MRCPNCGIENPDTNQFCRECRTEFSHFCSQCRAEILRSDKFCGKCGHKLTPTSEPIQKDLSFEEKLEKIQRYLPKGITEKVLSQRDKIEGERKQVTVMFCDMEGFTGLVEKLGPEEAYGIMDRVYDILIHKVHDYDGTVNEMTGDGIMALFGAPIALEDAPQRAIRSAYAIHREMTRFSNKLEQEIEGIQTIKMRIGIHTGPVVVGTLGNDLRVEFKAVGDTVNLASRMEGLAEPGTSYVSEETFKLTEGFFRFEGLGEREIKGKEELVNVYRVIAPSTRRTRFDVSTERGLTHFIGRERELELLLDGFKRSKSGRGQTFSITAEAGVGKSRLLYEFRKAVTNENVTFLEGKCLSYSRGVAYHPVIDILKANFDIRGSDRDSEIKKKVKRQLKVLEADEASTLPYLLELLSVNDSGFDTISMSPEARQERIIQVLKKIVLKGSEIRPLIIAIEDLHWIDKSSEDVFKNMLGSITGAKVFLMFTYRPESNHSWGSKSYHNQWNLNRLSNRESLTMLTYLLEAKKIDKALEGLIIDKTEGVPFYIEELTRSLIDLKIIELKNERYYITKNIEDFFIPSSIQDIIMSRIDILPEAAKELIQIGSVIGREFRFELIREISDLSDKNLLKYLAELNESEIIYERGFYPNIRYIFKHALTRDTIYDSISSKRKKKLHVKIGNVIEKLYAVEINQYFEILAEHFINGWSFEKGAKYAYQAGRKARKSGLFIDAMEYVKKMIFCLESLPDTEENQIKIIDARTKLSDYCMGLNYHVDAKNVIEPVIALAEKLNYRKPLPKIYLALGSYQQQVIGNNAEGKKLLQKAIKHAEEIQDGYALWTSQYYLGVLYAGEADFEQGQNLLQKCIDISTSVNDKGMITLIKSNKAFFIDFWKGDIQEAFQLSDKALQGSIADDLKDTRSKGMAYCCHGHSCYGKGRFKEAEENLLNSIAICQSNGNFNFQAFSSYILGEVYKDINQYESAQRYFRHALNLLESHDYLPSLRQCCKIGITVTDIIIGNEHIDLQKLLHYYGGISLIAYQGHMACHIGEALSKLKNRQTHNPDDWFKKAIEIDTQYKLKWWLGKAYARYSDYFKRQNKLHKSRDLMTKAIEIMKECGSDGWVERYEKTLSTPL